jgi:hypothetical protein
MCRTKRPGPGNHESGDTASIACDCAEAIQAIATELEQLREQNRLLHESAGFFAALSERLNTQLRMQRSVDQSAFSFSPGASSTPSAGSPPHSRARQSRG